MFHFRLPFCQAASAKPTRRRRKRKSENVKKTESERKTKRDTKRRTGKMSGREIGTWRERRNERVIGSVSSGKGNTGKLIRTGSVTQGV